MRSAANADIERTALGLDQAGGDDVSPVFDSLIRSEEAGAEHGGVPPLEEVGGERGHPQQTEHSRRLSPLSFMQLVHGQAIQISANRHQLTPDEITALTEAWSEGFLWDPRGMTSPRRTNRDLENLAWANGQVARQTIMLRDQTILPYWGMLRHLLQNALRSLTHIRQADVYYDTSFPPGREAR